MSFALSTDLLLARESKMHKRLHAACPENRKFLFQIRDGEKRKKFYKIFQELFIYGEMWSF